MVLLIQGFFIISCEILYFMRTMSANPWGNITACTAWLSCTSCPCYQSTDSVLHSHSPLSTQSTKMTSPFTLLISAALLFLLASPAAGWCTTAGGVGEHSKSCPSSVGKRQLRVNSLGIFHCRFWCLFCHLPVLRCQWQSNPHSRCSLSSWYLLLCLWCLSLWQVSTSGITIHKHSTTRLLTSPICCTKGTGGATINCHNYCDSYPEDCWGWDGRYALDLIEIVYVF